jgi:hypothetical protein
MPAVPLGVDLSGSIEHTHGIIAQLIHYCQRLLVATALTLVVAGESEFASKIG